VKTRLIKACLHWKNIGACITVFGVALMSWAARDWMLFSGMLIGIGVGGLFEKEI